MGPESTPESCLKQAMACIQKAIDGISLENGSASPELQKDLGSSDVICKLTEITGTLERCMETQKLVNDLASGKMKCTTCGATSVGFDCHNGASSTPATQRSSEERRKVSEDEDDDQDEKCSSIGSQRIASVDSSSSVDGFEHPVRSVSSSISAPAEEEETMIAMDDNDSDLVIKTILNSVKQEEIIKQEIKEELPEQELNLESILQNSLLSMSQQDGNLPPSDDDDKEQQDLINNFFQHFLQSQANMLENVSTSSETDSSQHSPPDAGLDVPLNLFGSLLAEMSTDATTSAEKAAARKRKSTPMKVPKTENGAGYVCPMEGCNKIFKEKGSVHRHFVTHIGMRFNCDKCKASYTQKHALMLHQKIHSNPDAYQCRGCGTNYTTQNGLRLHRQRNPGCMEATIGLHNSPSTKQMVSAP